MYHILIDLHIDRGYYTHFHQCCMFEDHILLMDIILLKLRFKTQFFYFCKSYQIHKLMHLYIHDCCNIYLHQDHMEKENMVQNRSDQSRKLNYLYIHHCLNMHLFLHHMEMWRIYLKNNI